MLMPSVLIIEDDEDGRRAVAKLFAKADWKVFEAADGDSGVELALRNRPEVILCDLLMPKSNGFQVCRTIRQQLQPTKIIVVSGRDYAVDRTSALEAGADEFLLKPITWEMLRESIDRLLIPQRPRATTSPEELGSVPPRIKELKDLEFHIGKVKVQATFANHPGICAGYRLFTSTGSIAYMPDNEPYEPLKMQLAVQNGIDANEARNFADAERAKMVEFLRDCDVAILDGQYTDEEYKRHVGWGHSSLSSVVWLALDANVKRVLLFHHDPSHDDDMIDRMLEQARELVRKSGKAMVIEEAREGAEIVLELPARSGKGG